MPGTPITLKGLLVTKQAPCLLICVVRSPHCRPSFMLDTILGSEGREEAKEGIQRGVAQEHYRETLWSSTGHWICSPGQAQNNKTVGTVSELDCICPGKPTRQE